jgi:hypothetical protein
MHFYDGQLTNNIYKQDSLTCSRVSKLQLYSDGAVLMRRAGLRPYTNLSKSLPFRLQKYELSPNICWARLT